MADSGFPLWSDEPSVRDLLSFRAVADTVVEAVLDDKLDPIALGVSGAWGSGKTSVLELVRAGLEQQVEDDGSRVLVIPTEPWRYDPAVGPKEALIGEVLDALSRELDPGVKSNATALLKKLVGRVNWAKAFKVAAKAGLALQLPSVDDVLGLIKEDPAKDESPERGLAGFREDFEALLASDDLEHISRVVVLVDDLDRCLPETVVETLEAIRLFLSAKGMSFVIAADEDRVADAIKQRLGASGPEEEGLETPAQLYLHKIVQTTVPLPALSLFDTNAYLFLLLVERDVPGPAFNELVASCDNLRIETGSLDDLEVPEGVDVAAHLATASRLTPMLYEKFRGNPRRLKRFLNDLNVRQAVAQRRGIKLHSDSVAKLMMLERLLPVDFEIVLGWLAKNQLRDKLQALEKLANEAEPEVPEPALEKTLKMTSSKSRTEVPEDLTDEGLTAGDFTEGLQRWAKLPPRLNDADVAGYLVLAASFAGKQLINEGLPERLRDIATGLVSSAKVDRDGITDEALRALNVADTRILITYLGSLTRDQPTIQRYSVAGMLRLAATHPDNDDAVVAALRRLPAADVTVPSVMLLKPEPKTTYGPVLAVWDVAAASGPVRRSIESVRASWGGESGN